MRGSKADVGIQFYRPNDNTIEVTVCSTVAFVYGSSGTRENCVWDGLEKGGGTVGTPPIGFYDGGITLTGAMGKRRAFNHADEASLEVTICCICHQRMTKTAAAAVENGRIENVISKCA